MRDQPGTRSIVFASAVCGAIVGSHDAPAPREGEHSAMDARRHWQRKAGAMIGVMLLLSGCAPQPALPAPTTAPPRALNVTATPTAPRFEPSSCPFPLYVAQVDGKTVDCGDVVVPEDHANPAGPTIRLAVARFRSSAAVPDPTPTIYLAGGPGASLLGPGLGAFAASFTGTRDFIAFDQRGIGHSTPALDCPEVKELTLQDFTYVLTTAEEADHAVAAARACRDRLTGAGIDLAAYTSAESAADINDIRAVFGYTAINLLGGSYGTRLALIVMRDFPAIVRSAVLDSVAPPQVGVISDSPATFDRALKLDFSLCVTQGACHVSVSVLQADFAQAVARLNATPATVHAVDPTTQRAYDLAITGDRLVYLIQEWLYSPDAIGRIPELIEEVKAGTTTTLTGLIAQRFFARIGSRLDLGMFFSVSCSDLVAPANATASRAGLLPAIRESRTLDGIYVLDTCGAWPVKQADGAERQPVTGDVPTLILESANDPVTPPSYGELVAGTLHKSFLVEGPGAGHGVSGTSCGMEMTAAFFTDPTRQPDTTCTTDWGVLFNSTT